MRVSRPTSAPPVALLLPGSGSDEVFVRAAFEAPLRCAGVELWAPPVSPGSGLVEGYRAELDRAAERAAARGAPLLVGGVSLGAQVAARWAARRPRGPDPAPPAGVLLVLPAWTGPPGDAPAATSAAATAAATRRYGWEAAVAALRAGAPGWLAEELARSWRRHGPALAESLEVTAGTDGPSESDLASLGVPVSVVALADDPIHPVAVARDWHRRLPRSALVVSTLAALGRDPAVLGRAAVLGWWRAATRADIPAG